MPIIGTPIFCLISFKPKNVRESWAFAIKYIDFDQGIRNDCDRLKILKYPGLMKSPLTLQFAIFEA